MARITSQKAKAMYEGSQFEMILAAAQRAREIRAGAVTKIKTKNGPVVTALKEIEEGLYTKKNFFDSFKKDNVKR